LNSIDQGRAIISIAKALRIYSGDDAQIRRHFSATRIAGKAGLLASSIRGYSDEGNALHPRRLQVLYNDVGLDVLEFGTYVKPWLLRNNLAFFANDNEGNEVLVATILTYDALLKAVVELFDHLEAELQLARACHHLVHFASELPMTIYSSRHRLSSMYGEEVATTALSLARGLSLVSVSRSSSKEAVIYSDRIWHHASNKAAQALPDFAPEAYTALEVLVDRVRNFQGLPELTLRRWAKNNNVEAILDFAIGIELITRTGIKTQSGKRYFLTTPHFYAEVEDEFGEDVCDRVKIFLNSIRNGQYFSSGIEGQIQDPVALLHALLNKAVIGPATAIGRNYMMAEKAGIVRVEDSPVQGRFNMVLVQDDVVNKTLEVIQGQSMMPSGRELTVDDLADNKGQFMSIPETRAQRAELPGEMREAEHEYVNAMRESW
jgi:hypothetical protein